MNEDQLIAWLRRRGKGLGGELIGDDCAFLPADQLWPADDDLGEASGPSRGPEIRHDEALAVTVDSQIADVHFPAGLDAALLARRVLAVNLSDLAAVGAAPLHAFLALSAPRDFDHRRFFSALLQACKTHGLRLSGGDLSCQPRITAVLTLLGRKTGSRFVERSTARPGHRLWLGGPIGESALGLACLDAGAEWSGRQIRLPDSLGQSRSLATAARRAVRRHLQPAPQLELGYWLAQRPEAAGLDISDGFARDLHRLCRSSQVGAEVQADLLPLDSRQRKLAETLGLDYLDLALFGGEDYVLLFTLPPGDSPPPAMGCHEVGRIVRRAGVVLVDGADRTPLPPRGFDHLDPLSA